MAESLINSIARLRVIEKRLLTKEIVGRMLAAPGYAECLKAISEAGWGEIGEGDEIESLTRSALSETYRLVDELMPKRFAPVTDVFRMRHDIINIKLLYKLRMRGVDPDTAELDPGGVYDNELLRKAIKKGDYSMLPKELKNALEELDVLTYKDPDPTLVSSSIDRAFIEYAEGLHNGFVREYFGAYCDFTNLLALARGFGKEMFLPEGELDIAKLETIASLMQEAPEKAAECIKSPLETSELKEKLRFGFAEYVRTGQTAAIEKARDEYLIELAGRRRSDISSPAPIIGFLLAREREAEIVRLILTAKRSGIPTAALEERSMALYG